ncbi:Stress response protein SCP2 [Actinacidiphila yanglinensis]|uniref:Stress response protein SCP2 n=1 Tax=Actinacidiphila yanglinensis TaxID=310779 RepID=A0A1H5SF83_9ACTN|nr:TerD family protein [Actinacidiphila yanglinensis]SEF49256.1 Stress response protein SCP2 [Actinacidiphila yanglinensis]
MTHVMVKGSNIPLDVSGIRAVLRWSPAAGTPDVDASVLLLGPDGRVRSDADFVFYNAPRHPSGLARHLPKKRGPEGLTDTVEVDLAALDPGVDRVVVAASCDGGPFRLVHDLVLALYDAAGPQHAAPVATFDVVPDTGQETALICGELYRRGSGWKFRALGQGYASGLVGLATEYGIAVDDGEPDSAGGAPSHGRHQAPPQGATAAAGPTAPMPAPTGGFTGAAGPTMPAAEPAGAYGYPLPAPYPSHVPAQPAYGYPQPVAAAAPPPPPPQRPVVHQQPQQGYPAYGYPQPVAAGGADGQFKLPPQGPQFQHA